jgi:hypothetical protein
MEHREEIASLREAFTGEFRLEVDRLRSNDNAERQSLIAHYETEIQRLKTELHKSVAALGDEQGKSRDTERQNKLRYATLGQQLQQLQSINDDLTAKLDESQRSGERQQNLATAKDLREGDRQATSSGEQQQAMRLLEALTAEVRFLKAKSRRSSTVSSFSQTDEVDRPNPFIGLATDMEHQLQFIEGLSCRSKASTPRGDVATNLITASYLTVREVLGSVEATMLLRDVLQDPNLEESDVIELLVRGLCLRIATRGDALPIAAPATRGGDGSRLRALSPPRVVLSSSNISSRIHVVSGASVVASRSPPLQYPHPLLVGRGTGR